MKKALVSLVLLFQFFSSISLAAAGTIIVGAVRVQILSTTLVRLELKGPKGFEDRPTFHIVKREWPGSTFSESGTSGYEFIKTADFVIKVPSNAASLRGISIEKSDGTLLWSYKSLPKDDRAWLPGVNDKVSAWAIADVPRIVPSAWGYSPAPGGTPYPDTNGWDLGNDAPDMYVFLPKGDPRRLRNDFLELTGRTEMVPLSALGYWDSRWYAYSEQTALKQIDDYRNRDIPIDNLVIDTDWRVSGSTGYEVNRRLFPDMARFLTAAHKKNVHIMFNDHPEPVGKALDQSEVVFRNTGLLSQLINGLDAWWFDRNWSVALTPPKGLNKEVWGMYLFNWIAKAFNPERRSLIMANVDGIDNGSLNNPPSIAAHRYSIQWTGDIKPTMDSLRSEVKNALREGMSGLLPYTSADIGGHVQDPTVEGYIRWMQYGALSPVMRPHCTKNLSRMPWAWGTLAEDISRNYIKMRYRLLPVFYGLARESYDTGDPMLRRCDFYYPEYIEAASDEQYLLGDNILVAPVFEADAGTRPVPTDWLRTPDGARGLKGEYFNNRTLSGRPITTAIDPGVDFDWRNGAPRRNIPQDNFGVRWTGNVTISGEDVYLQVSTDDGVRLYIDNKLVIDGWKDQAVTDYRTFERLRKGTTHTIRLDYYENGGEAVCKLRWLPAVGKASVKRDLWIPPGTWIDPWTGTAYTGPRTVTADVSIYKMPVYIRSGAVIPLAPEMSYTGEKPWDPITLDVYPGFGKSEGARLYEDDTVSTGYRSGAYRATAFTAEYDTNHKQISVNIGSAAGSYPGALKDRAWVIRVHQLPGQVNAHPSSVFVDGVKVEFSIVKQDTKAMPFATGGGSADGDVIEVGLPSKTVDLPRSLVIDY